MDHRAPHSLATALLILLVGAAALNACTEASRTNDAGIEQVFLPALF